VDKLILIEKLEKPPVEEYSMEFVERKGLGHPDHIIDTACENVSIKLSKYYLEHIGTILHHNVDKGLLIGGRAIPRFGGGEVIEPIEIIVAGRATTKAGNIEIPVVDIAVNAIKDSIRNNFRFLDPEEHLSIMIKIRPGSVDLVKLFERGKEVPSSNDTSFGVSFAPLTLSENMALKIEKYLNSRLFKTKVPYLGEDIKVMVLRIKDEYKITIAAAFIDRFFASPSEYTAAKEEVIDKVKDLLISMGIDLSKVDIQLNTADDITNGIYYITVTGTSAEAGDDGNTGRGNRVNGLITPNRQMSLEAAAGKNPISHVGKIYNVLAYKISNRIYNEVEGLLEVYVKILSQIGAPITRPQAVHIQFISKELNSMKIDTKIKRIVEEELEYDAFKKLTKEILDEKYQLF